MPKITEEYGKLKMSYSDQEYVLDIPNLIEVQIASYREFLQAHRPPHLRLKQGLQEIFQEIFPIQDFTGNLILEFVEYRLGLDRCKDCPEKTVEKGVEKVKECLYYNCGHKEKDCTFATIDTVPYRVKHDPVKCKKRDATYGIPLSIVIRLINKLSGEVKEQTIFLVNLPIMTERGTFIINGAERVVVSQLHRSPGVYYKYDKIKKQYLAKVIPYRGAWLEFELDVIKDAIHVRIDRKRKQPVTVLFKALGLTVEEIMELFAHNEYIVNTLQIDKTKSMTEALMDVYSKLRPGEPFTEDNAQNLLDQLFFDPRKYDLAEVGRYKLNKKFRLRDRIMSKIAGESIVRTSDGSGLIEIEPGEQIGPRLASRIEEVGVPSLKLTTLDGDEMTVINERDSEEVVLVDREAYRKALMNKTLAENVIDPKDATKILYALDTPITAEIAQKLNRAAKIPSIKVRMTDGSIRELRRADYETLSPEAEENLKRRVLNRRLSAPVVNPKDKKTVIADAGALVTLSVYEEIKNARVDRFEVKKGRILTRSDIIAAVRYLIDLCNGLGHVDDIDHLGSRRIRRCGELLQNQFRLSLMRMERDIKDRMTLQDTQNVTSQSLINARPVAAMIKDFFGSSQLSQFMDQTNPLSELTHKRRISALGPGGVRRERAGYEVRDVHPTHYGRICPIETPEGPNAGLIGSLSIFSNINDFGFIESPFREVVDRKLTGDITYLDAYEEDEYHVSPFDVAYDAKTKKVKEDFVTAKYLDAEEHEFALVPAEKVGLMLVSPLQMVSVATALIPFLEHDDANRALMGTNMQRQAVPLLRTEPALVGTGLENRTASDSGSILTCSADGVVKYVDADRVLVERPPRTFQDSLVAVYPIEPVTKPGGKEVLAPAGVQITREVAAKIEDAGVKELHVVRPDGDTVHVLHSDWEGAKIKQHKPQIDEYLLAKFQRSNQGTCINMRPCVKKGQKVKKGELIADGPSTSYGALALGRNVNIVFMPWEGYNFEDAILVSDTLVHDDTFTSIHIEEYEIETRDTRLGVEEITRDIPNIGADALMNLDDQGIVRIGAVVESGDILVGKVTPKGETELTAEDKLLRAIFGEKAREVRNTSYTVPHGEGGKVVDVMVFSRENKDELSHGVNKMVRVFLAQKRKITEGDKIAGRHGNKGVIAKILPAKDMPFLEDGSPIQIVLNPLGVPSRMNVGQVLETHLGYLGQLLGVRVDTPIFDGANEGQIREGLALARVLHYGKQLLFDVERERPFAEIRYRDVPKHLAHIREVFREAGIHKVTAYLFKNCQPVLYHTESGLPLGTVDVAKLSEAEIEKRLHAGDFTSMITFTPKVKVETHETAVYVAELSDRPGDRVRKVKDAKDLPTQTHEIPCKQFSKEELVAFKKALASVDLHKFETGKQKVYDGRNGDAFDNEVTVGSMYIMKLAHLVDDKVHARATGPYSLVTQQPLGGKAQFGGQRFGEMEVWALEAYGVAHTLQELLTVKSDDVEGRVEVYEAIIKGEHVIRPSVPESFKVLVSELQSLCLKVELLKEDKTIDLLSEPEPRFDPDFAGSIRASI